MKILYGYGNSTHRLYRQKLVALAGSLIKRGVLLNTPQQPCVEL